MPIACASIFFGLAYLGSGSIEFATVGFFPWRPPGYCIRARKRTMLVKLDRHDPYFRASDVGVTAVGGLVCEELAGPEWQRTRAAAWLKALEDVGAVRHELFDALYEEPICPEMRQCSKNALKPLLAPRTRKRHAHSHRR